MFATSLETYENQSVAAVQQARKITGTLTDAVGEPIIGATVLEKGNPSNGTITDMDGNFSLSVQPGTVLVVSYIGYKTQEVTATVGKAINVTLQEDNEMLDEVVVVGYGTMKRSDLTGSVVSVTGDELKKSVVTSLDQALQGRAAGVQVTQNSGTPGGGQHPWYQLLERQRTALRYRRCSHLRQQHQQQQRTQFHQPCRHRFHGSIERCIGHSHLW